jgi:osmotically-inducible protein OsmY
MAWLVSAFLLIASIDDATLKSIIIEELNESPVVNANDFGVHAENGIVILDGEVPNIVAHERAIEIARNIKGVRSVVDLIEVTPVIRPDQTLRRLIHERLDSDEATRDESLEVEVRDGAVILKGEVDSRTEADWIVRLVKQIPGIQIVESRIRSAHGKRRDDTDILHDVRQQFQWDALLDEDPIVVTVSEGVVKLAGRVGSEEEKWHARIRARVDGVREVIDELTIDPSLNDDHHRDPRMARLAEPQVEQAILDAWNVDPRIHDIDVRIESSYGHVKLYGEVPSLPMKLAVEQTARNTFAVMRVSSYLRVACQQPREDEEIRQDILKAFADDPIVDRFEIAVSALDGEVFLSGDVESYYEKGRAEEVALQVTGIVELHNRLEVSDDAPELDPDFYAFEPVKATEGGDVGTIHVRPDADIKRAIESELWWSLLVDADQVNVKVEAGVATLTGTVDSAVEARAAIANAMQGGAVVVKNRLEIKNR